MDENAGLDALVVNSIKESLRFGTPLESSNIRVDATCTFGNTTGPNVEIEVIVSLQNQIIRRPWPVIRDHNELTEVIRTRLSKILSEERIGDIIWTNAQSIPRPGGQPNAWVVTRISGYLLP